VRPPEPYAGDDLATWLRAQLDDDERHAQMLPMGFPADSRWTEQDVTAIAWAADPARALAEVAAKRAMIDLHDPGTTTTPWWCASCLDTASPEPDLMALAPCPVLRLLALPYADQPGYREEWRP
jgi:hypothetical protein